MRWFLEARWLNMLVLLLLFVAGTGADQTLVDNLKKQTVFDVSLFVSQFESVLGTLKHGVVFVVRNSGMPSVEKNKESAFLGTHQFVNGVRAIFTSSTWDQGNKEPRGHFKTFKNSDGVYMFFFKNGTSFLLNNSTVLEDSKGSVYTVSGKQTVAYFLDSALVPLPQKITMKKYLENGNYKTMSELITALNDPAISTVYSPTPEIKISYTYFATSDDDWKKISEEEKKSLTATNDAKKKLIMNQVVSGTPYFVSRKTQVFNVLPTKGADSPRSTIFRSVDGKDYIVTKGVTARILQANQVISNGVVHVVDWPIGVRVGTVPNEMKNFSSFFYQECVKVASCVDQLNSTTSFSAFVPLGLKTLPELAAMSTLQKETFFSLHFAEGFWTRYSLEKAQKERKHMTAAAPNPKRMRVNLAKVGNSSVLYLDVRALPVSLTTGYVSSMIHDFARPAEGGNVFSVSVPFGIYNYTVLDYLKTRRTDLYSSFLNDYPGLGVDLNDKNVLYTVFAPTNLAIARWKSNEENGAAIYNKKDTRNWVLRRHIIKGIKMILEDWKKGEAKLFSTMNTPKDEYKAKVTIDDVDGSIATKGSVSISTYTKALVDIYQGGIQASNGIVYPVDDVLSMSTDINTICISDTKRCGQQALTASLLTISFLLTLVAVIL